MDAVVFEVLSSGRVDLCSALEPCGTHEQGIHAGQLIRSIVLEVRERSVYAKCIGTGTYTFQLPQGMCLDATKAGNIAHLMNHSCSANCFSAVKAIPMPKEDDGCLKATNKVVLIAKRDIESGAELTYDYRCARTRESVSCPYNSQTSQCG